MKKLVILAIVSFSIFPTYSNADYIVTGPIKGLFCTWMIFDVCSNKEVNGLLQDGRIVPLPRRFRDVDNYSSAKERCWINTGGSGFGQLFSSSRLKFYHGPKKLGTPKTITFKCKKVP